MRKSLPVGPSLGVMIQEDPETQRRHLTHTFQMFQHGDPRLKRHSVTQGGAEIFASIKKTPTFKNMIPARSIENFRKKAARHLRRASSVENFEYLLRISDRIRTQGGPIF